MSLRVGALGLGLTLVAALLSSTGTALAAAPEDSLGTVQVACTTGPAGEDVFEVTVSFTHRGPAEVRVYGQVDGRLDDSDHGWFRGSGADTFVGRLWAPTPRSVEVHLLKIDHRARALVDVATPVTAGPVSCQT